MISAVNKIWKGSYSIDPPPQKKVPTEDIKIKQTELYYEYSTQNCSLAAY